MTTASQLIATSQAAFDAIASTLPLGSVGYENEVNEAGERCVWLEPAVARRHARPRRGYSDVICGWRRKASSKGLADGLELSRIYVSAFLQLVANHVSPISEINPRRESAAESRLQFARPPQI